MFSTSSQSDFFLFIQFTWVLRSGKPPQGFDECEYPLGLKTPTVRGDDKKHVVAALINVQFKIGLVQAIENEM